MDVAIKDFAVTMNPGSKGITLDVYDTKGKHLGDLRIGKATIEWCKGKTQQGNGVKVRWDSLIEWFEADE
jgi:hypothetical protein